MKTAIKRTLALAGMTLAITGCPMARTELSGFIDPDFDGHEAYTTILINAKEEDLQVRLNVESIYANFLKSKYACTAYSAIKLMPPTKTYSTAEANKIYQKYGIDAVLEVSTTQQGEDLEYIPKTTTTTKEGNVKGSAHGAVYRESTTKSESGGYYISNPWAKFRVNLLDVQSNKIAWTASSRTEGNRFAEFKDLIQSQATAVAEEMFKFQLLDK